MRLKKVLTMSSTTSLHFFLRLTLVCITGAFALHGSRAKAQQGTYADQYLLPPHTAFTCKNSTEQERIKKYIEVNYPKHHKIEGRTDSFSGQTLPPSPLAILGAVAFETLKWQKGCSDLCPIFKPVKPLGNGWVNAGQYGNDQESGCKDRWIKLVSRSSGRIEVEWTSTSRLSEGPVYAKYPATLQIKCASREYWENGSWAPVNSRTIVGEAAKKFC